MITIYGDRGSGNCMKVAYVVHYLTIPYQWVDVDITRQQSRTPAFLARNPAGQVPVVELEDGSALAQSNAIIFYLAEGSDLVPKERLQRAKMLEWMFWEQYSHEPYVAVCRYHKVYLGRSDDELDPDRVSRGNAALDLMESHLGRAAWLVGAEPSLADVSLVAYTRLAHEGGFDLSARPSVREWIARVEQHLRLADIAW